MKNLPSKIIVFLFISFLASCTYFRPKLTDAVRESNILVQENVEASKIANQVTQKNIEKTSTLLSTYKFDTNLFNSPAFFDARVTLELGKQSSSLTDNLLDRTLHITGQPPGRQNSRIESLLSTNEVIRNQALQNEDFRESHETILIKQINELEQKLLNYGAEYEKQRNESIIKRFGWGTSIFLIIGGFICLLIFFPPIAGLLVKLIPQFVKVFGIVGRGVVDNIISGVGTVRNQLKTEIKMSKEKNYTTKEVLELLDNELKKSTDKADKNVIEYLRKTEKV